MSSRRAHLRPRKGRGDTAKTSRKTTRQPARPAARHSPENVARDGSRRMPPASRARAAGNQDRAPPCGGQDDISVAAAPERSAESPSHAPPGHPTDTPLPAESNPLRHTRHSYHCRRSRPNAGQTVRHPGHRGATVSRSVRDDRDIHSEDARRMAVGIPVADRNVHRLGADARRHGRARARQAGEENQTEDPAVDISDRGEQESGCMVRQPGAAQACRGRI